MRDNPIKPATANIGPPAIGRGWFIALGILLIGVGLLSLLFPFLAAWSVELVAGATLLVGGFLTLIHATRVRGWRGTGFQVLLGLLYTGGGIIFLANPFAGLLALTVMLGAFFAADGVARIMLALRIRPQRAWWLFLLTGLASLVLGVLAWLGLPSGWSVAILGIVVGVNMILTGVSFVCCNGTDNRSALVPLG